MIGIDAEPGLPVAVVWRHLRALPDGHARSSAKRDQCRVLDLLQRVELQARSPEPVTLQPATGCANLYCVSTEALASCGQRQKRHATSIRPKVQRNLRAHISRRACRWSSRSFG
ncbi:MAG: hypothetical protein QOI20_3422 [Acidimicrobiaceae bacterium]|nr:hypothetical protein [Acidimicrobiaceae bacterium]